MGIPSYFSYIIRNYPRIVSKLFENTTTFHHLFLDCNSIVYDSVRTFIDVVPTDEEVIAAVIHKIDQYISDVSPLRTVYIAFDGVAPLAKMKQQRTRRYRSVFMSRLNERLNINQRGASWDTTKITPGTIFMKKLSVKMNEYYNCHYEKQGRNIVVSCSDQPGEGEHKLFHYIREHPMKNDNVLIYGLDSDLFMLSIFNHEFYRNAYIFREAPDFLKRNIVPCENNMSRKKPPTTVDDNNCYLIDVEMLRKSILQEMGFKDPRRIYDYAFLCFFLGNDFLPHFPALNIRTTGIQTLLDVYNACFSKTPDRFLVYVTENTNTDGRAREFKINWKNLECILKRLGALEHDLFLNEHRIRSRFDTWVWNEPKTVEEKEKMIDSLPIMFRSREKYICPSEQGWETRYYKLFFPDVSDVSDVCCNHFEGLEWVLKYYTGACVDYGWVYKWHYGPLLNDMYRSVSRIDKSFWKSAVTNPLTELVQLEHVLPPSKYELLDEETRIILNNKIVPKPDNQEFADWDLSQYVRHVWE